MRRFTAVLSLGVFVALAGAVLPAIAGDYGQVEYSCTQCLRDAIDDDITLCVFSCELDWNAAYYRLARGL